MADADNEGVAVNIKSVTAVTLISIAYLLLSKFLIGFKSDEVTLVVIFNVLFYLSSFTRKFILGFSVFIIFWIIFDYMKAFPNYNYATVHIEGIYNFEKHLFGIHTNGTILTPNEYWKANGLTFLDIMSGIFYLCWIPVPLGFAAFLFFRSRKLFLYFSLTFLLVNLIGFVIYYAFPAAPPWYVQLYGFDFHAHTPGNTAGLGKFDAYFHTGVFKGIYAKSSNVFAAMPSLHSAYPVVVLYYGIRNRLGLANMFFGLVMVGIWFAAVYASHHYVLDVLAGILCAITGILLFNRLAKLHPVQLFLEKYERVIK